MEGSGDALEAMDGVVVRGGNAVDRQNLLPAVTGADVAQQPEKSEMGIVSEVLTVEDRAIVGKEGVKVFAEVEERGDGEGGGKGMEDAAETVEAGVEESGRHKEDGAEMAEKEGAGGQNKKDGDYAETRQNDSGRDRGLPSEEDEELEDFEGEEDEREGEDDEEEALGEDREGRFPTTPSSEPLGPPTSNLTPPSDRNTSEFANGGYYDEEEDEDEEEEGNEDDEDDDSEANAQPLLKKQKSLISLTTESSKFPSTSTKIPENLQPPVGSSAATVSTTASKKSKKKNSNVWRKSASRKGKKKGKSVPSNNLTPPEDKVFITPIPRFPDRSDDSPDATICLSKVYKAEKVELSEDRLTAGSTKGYRMVRTTRGVIEGTWYFEISVLRLGETGHTRLGWTTEKGDLQAPVGYDGNSYGYRDIDGTKIHRALREKYGDEGYVEGDVIGFYINLPDGESYAPKPPHLVWYKGQRYMCSADAKDDPPKVIPGSEITFFKNGKCQGTAFTDLYGGRYYPAASMYTLPNQPNCEVRFNFGPEFQCFPKDFGGRPAPRPVIEAPYHGYANKVEGSSENGTAEKQANGISS